MKLSFHAPYVKCTDAMDGEIVWVSFDTILADNETAEDNRKTPYVGISRNFEFPGPAGIDWHDGNDCEGGGAIKSAVLEGNRIFIIVESGNTIEITFRLNHVQFKELEESLQPMLGNRLKEQ